MQVRTYQQQIRDARFIPEIKRAMILAQQDYSAVWKIDQKDKSIRQYYSDLSAVGQDQQKAIEMC